MIDAQNYLPLAKAFLYLDSDAVVTCNYSLSDIASFMRQDLRWDIKLKPFAVNQDGPGWACKNTLKKGYTYCLNSGVVFWYRSVISTRILEYWWNSAGVDQCEKRFPTVANLNCLAGAIFQISFYFKVA